MTTRKDHGRELGLARRKGNTLPEGVTRMGNRYKAQIRQDGTTRYLGLFNTPTQAHMAYLAAKGESKTPVVITKNLATKIATQSKPAPGFKKLPIGYNPVSCVEHGEVDCEHCNQVQ